MDMNNTQPDAAALANAEFAKQLATITAAAHHMDACRHEFACPEDEVLLDHVKGMLDEKDNEIALAHKIHDQVCTALRSEADALRAQLENLTASGIHSCGDACHRPMCVLRRERDALQSLADGLAGALNHAKQSIEYLGGKGNGVWCECSSALSAYTAAQAGTGSNTPSP